MIVTITGSNNFLVETELKNILSDFKNLHGEIAIEQIDGSDVEYQAIFESVSNLSFLTPSKMIILRRGSGNKIFMDSIEEIIKNTPDTNDLVIIEPNIDKRLAYYKTLKKLTDLREYNELDSNQLVRWIDEEVEKRGGQISNADIRHLIDLTGLNQMKLSNEITKLISYQRRINKESIDLLVEPIPQTTIFQLLDAAFSGQSKQLLKIYDDQKKQKIEPQQIIAMLAWQLHILAIIKASGKDSSGKIAKENNLSPFVVSKSLNIAQRLNLGDIKKLTGNLLELDVKLKNKNIDIDEALLQLLLSIHV